MATRRELLRMFGTAAGGALLSSCSSGPGPASPGGLRATLPNGLACQPLVTRDGSSAKVLSDLVKLSPGVLMNDVGDIWLCGFDASDQQGLWHLKLDLRGATPAISDQRRLLRIGQQLAGGRLQRIYNVDANNTGGVVACLQLETKVGTFTKPMSGVHFAGDGSTFEPLLTYGTKIAGPTGPAKIGATVGDVDTHGSHDLLVTSQFGSATNTNYSGVLHLPNASVAGAKVVLHSEATMPQGGGTLVHFGLLDLHETGHFVAQAYAPPLLTGTPTGNEGSASMILAGNVNDSSAKTRLVSAEPSLRAGRAAGQGITAIGPRVGASGQVAYVLHTSSDAHELRVNGVAMAHTGGTTPRGKVIQSIGAGVVCGKPGLCWFTVGYANGGTEMCVTNGQDVHSVLATGDKIAGHTVDTIYQGFHSSQADAAGRIIFAAYYADGGRAIVLGTPA